jgi:hypothetical protein
MEIITYLKADYYCSANINMLVKSNTTIWVLRIQNYEMYTKYIWKTSSQENI